MLECLILGDSLALGVGQARPGCVTLAQTGITSSAFIATFLPRMPRSASRVVISLGVNDDPTMSTLDNLRAFRRELQAQDVVWLLPGQKPAVREAIITVAHERRDRLVDTTPQVGPDHLHPTGTGYRVIATWTLEQSGRQPSFAGQSYAALQFPAVPGRQQIGGEPNMSGNLRQYRANPVIVYPNTFNLHVRYGGIIPMFRNTEPVPK